jgi:SNF2 family DNA or RNA helicase
LLRPGAGKTAIILSIYAILRNKEFLDRMLVIAPKTAALDTWPEEPLVWEQFCDLKVHIMQGEGRNNVPNDADIYVVNYDNLEWLVKSGFLDWFKGQMLCIDESTRIKNSNTKRFKIIKQMLHIFSRRYILTGTVRPNGLLDLFGQIYALDEGASLGRYITHYRTMYFYPSGYGGYTWMPQPDAELRIGEKIAPLVEVIEDSDIEDMPALITKTTYVTLPPKVMDVYKEMEDELITQIQDEAVVAANAAVASGKCRQICAGALYLKAANLSASWKRTKDYAILHTEKIDALNELLEDLNGDPLFILYEFEFERELMMQNLKGAGGCISGVSDKKAQAYIRQFKDGNLPWLIGQFQSASLSLNLQFNCSNVAMPSVTWNQEYFDQGIQRVRRPGNQKSSVTVHYIVARNTIDERVVRVVNGKDFSQRSFMNMLKGLAY